MVGKRVIFCLGVEIGTAVSHRATLSMLKLMWCCFLMFSVENLGYLFNFRGKIIHGFECGAKLEYVDGFTLGGDVGAVFSVCNIRGCTTGSTLRSCAGVLVIFCGEIF